MLANKTGSRGLPGGAENAMKVIGELKKIALRLIVLHNPPIPPVA